MENTDLAITQTNEQSKGKQGIWFYSGHEHRYLFIETTPFQRTNFKALVVPKRKVEEDPLMLP